MKKLLCMTLALAMFFSYMTVNGYASAETAEKWNTLYTEDFSDYSDTDALGKSFSNEKKSRFFSNLAGAAILKASDGNVLLNDWHRFAWRPWGAATGKNLAATDCKLDFDMSAGSGAGMYISMAKGQNAADTFGGIRIDNTSLYLADNNTNGNKGGTQTLIGTIPNNWIHVTVWFEYSQKKITVQTTQNGITTNYGTIDVTNGLNENDGYECVMFYSNRTNNAAIAFDNLKFAVVNPDAKQMEWRTVQTEDMEGYNAVAATTFTNNVTGFSGYNNANLTVKKIDDTNKQAISGTGSWNRMKYEFPDVKNPRFLKISFDFMSEDTRIGGWVGPVLRTEINNHTNGLSDGGIRFDGTAIYMVDNNTTENGLGYYIKSRIGTYIPTSWYHFDLIYDMKASSYTVFLNSEYAGSINLSNAVDLTSLNNLLVRATNNDGFSKSYFDNLTIAVSNSAPTELEQENIAAGKVVLTQLYNNADVPAAKLCCAGYDEADKLCEVIVLDLKNDALMTYLLTKTEGLTYKVFTWDADQKPLEAVIGVQ